MSTPNNYFSTPLLSLPHSFVRLRWVLLLLLLVRFMNVNIENVICTNQAIEKVQSVWNLTFSEWKKYSLLES